MVVQFHILGFSTHLGFRDVAYLLHHAFVHRKKAGTSPLQPLKSYRCATPNSATIKISYSTVFCSLVPKPEESTDIAPPSANDDEKTISTQGNVTRNTRAPSGYQNNSASNYNRSNNGMQRQVSWCFRTVSRLCQF